MTARRPANGRIRSERGLGAITQRGDSWVWRRSIYIDGRRKWIWDRYVTEAAARAAQAAAKPATPGDALTVGEWLTRWSGQQVGVHEIQEPPNALIQGQTTQGDVTGVVCRVSP